MEDVDDEIIRKDLLAQQSGFIDLKHFEAFKSDTVFGLLRFGDRFLQALGLALKYAFFNDSRKIIRYWHQECEQHALLYKIYIAKLKGEKQDGSQPENNPK